MATVVDALGSRFGDEVEPAHEILRDPELTRLLSRRTCREYGPAPVSSDLVDALLRVAFSASSKSDYQQASVIKVEDPGRRADLAALVPSMPWIGRSPAFLVFCADARRLARICALRAHPQPNANLEAFFNASVDAALVLQTFILYGWSEDKARQAAAREGSGFGAAVRAQGFTLD
jgi:FMN reductase [NAD(P)H]